MPHSMKLFRRLLFAAVPLLLAAQQGDPLLRDPDLVARDVRWGKVSAAAAAADYGVILAGPDVDAEATARLRETMRTARPAQRPFFDRGPGYARLADGRSCAEVDWI